MSEGRVGQRRRWIAAFVGVVIVAIGVWFWSAGTLSKDTWSSTSENCCLVAVTDQAAHRIVVYDPNDADWTAESAVQWSWTPNTLADFERLRSAWGLPSDAKLRRIDAWKGLWVVVTDSRGMAAIVPYPAGDSMKWGLNVGGNPHSAELLPNGNIAVAASTGGWVRVYASSQGSSSSNYAEYKFPGAHGVQWDPKLNLLWTVGDDYLVALKVGGTDALPVLEEVRKIDLPTKHGHDLQPVIGDNDRLWISTGSKVYQFVKSTNEFNSVYPGSESISRPGVKSIGNLPEGQVVLTVPDKTKGIAKGCTRNTWCTETVDFMMTAMSRTIPGAELYKARVWSSDYQ